MDEATELELYRAMTRARAFELLLARLWDEGSISGEMHLGTGEEAIAATLAQLLRPDDAVAIDHRSTPLLTALGVDLVDVLREVLGDPRGLCGGRGGHMHLYVPERRIASSGIVGAAAPTAVGFALSAERLRRGSLAVALLGDGAMNQGMVMESLNLAVAWSLPVLFVCKDNGWAVTTQSRDVTGGDLIERAAAFGLQTWDVDGGDLPALWTAMQEACERTRRKSAPCFVRAVCSRLDGHYLGDTLTKISHHPIGEGKELLSKVTSAALSRGGGGLLARAGSLVGILGTMHDARKDRRGGKTDPLERARSALRAHADALARMDEAAVEEMEQVCARAREGAA